MRAPGGLREQAFLAIFRQSTLENAPEWYPDLNQAAALAEYEAGFWAYWKAPFWQK